MGQGPRTRAVDSRGKPVKGVYIRDGIYSILFTRDGKTHIKNVEAQTLAEARMERERILETLRGNKKKSIPTKELDQLYTDARKLSQQMSLLKNKVNAAARKDISAAELKTLEATDFIFDAWKKA